MTDQKPNGYEKMSKRQQAIVNDIRIMETGSVTAGQLHQIRGRYIELAVENEKAKQALELAILARKLEKLLGKDKAPRPRPKADEKEKAPPADANEAMQGLAQHCDKVLNGKDYNNPNFGFAILVTKFGEGAGDVGYVSNAEKDGMLDLMEDYAKAARARD